MIVPLLVLSVVGSAPAVSIPQVDEGPLVSRELQKEIDRAIDRGAQALLESQEIDGSWRHDLIGYGPGATGLVSYTLLKCGVASDHPALQRAFTFMGRQPAEKTYAAATILMALSARGDAKDRPWAEELVEKLIRWRQPEGWGYPDGRPDLSNSQFAGLGLRAADAMGVKIKQKDWDKLGEIALDYFDTARNSGYTPSGFYYEQGAKLPTGSMTSAGLTMVGIALEHWRGRQQQELVVAQKRALAWLGEYFSVDFNPKPNTESGQSGRPHYYLYGLERVGSLFGVDDFGGKPWYALGARKLVDEQSPAGRWNDQAESCFALLFLARATGKSGVVDSGSAVARAPSERGIYGSDNPDAEVSLRASGTDELTIWVSSFGTKVVKKYAPDSETVEGRLEPLLVRRVDYWAERVEGGGGRELLATVEVDPGATARERANARFPVKHSLIGPADYDISAEVTIVDFADGSDVFFKSPPLRVHAGIGVDSRWLTYATDPERNAFGSMEITMTSSSQKEGPQFAPEKAIDNLQGVGWLSAESDDRPWIRLEFERPPRSGTLILSPSLNPASDHPTPRPTVVRVMANGDDTDAFEVELDPNPRFKTEIKLPPKLRMRSLTLTLVRTTAPGSGLNEIEFRTR